MLVNADFSLPAIVTPDQYRWVPSLQGGVERVMLDRIGEEAARATSIVRYAPSSHFPSHKHPGGEEIFVLSGTFSEKNRHYPAGWYMRNPPNSSHQPFSSDGAIIFVKLRQMSPDEDRSVRVDTRVSSGWQSRSGRSIFPLFSGAAERVCLEHLSPNEALFRGTVGSAELLVLAGELRSRGRGYPRGSWIRLPEGDYLDWVSGGRGAVVYIKTGHLVTMTTGS